MKLIEKAGYVAGIAVFAFDRIVSGSLERWVPGYSEGYEAAYNHWAERENRKANDASDSTHASGLRGRIATLCDLFDGDMSLD